MRIPLWTLRARRCLVFLVLILIPVAAAQAALHSRLGGQAYYDDVLDITWTQDADINGNNNWYDSLSWADGLALGGATDWRLPNMDSNGDLTFVDCGVATEVDCRDNEMGYLFHQNGISWSSPGVFSNVRNNQYWAINENGQNNAWNLQMSSGSQQFFTKGALKPAFAVHAGDIDPPPPLPFSSKWGMALMALVLMGMLAYSGYRLSRANLSTN